jgi:hypothetical protein
MPLLHFSGNDLKLDVPQTKVVLSFFFPDVPEIDFINITDMDRSFAQALLVEAIDASVTMGYVQTLFEKSAKPNAAVKDIAKALIKQAAGNWFRHLTGKDFADPRIYVSVLNTLRVNWKSEFKLRVVTGEYTAY